MGIPKAGPASAGRATSKAVKDGPGRVARTFALLACLLGAAVIVGGSWMVHTGQVEPLVQRLSCEHLDFDGDGRIAAFPEAPCT